MSGRAPIAVYGATGYTGRLMARALHDAGREVVVAGRSREKVEALAADLGSGAHPVAASLDDADALRAALADAAAVVNCAGPFVRTGAPVLTAAIATGTHYVDTTGEQPWIRRAFDEHGAAARAAGVTVVPAMGFDYVPGDLLAAVVGGPLQPLRELTLAYALAGFGATRGTMRSALEMLGAEEVVYEDGSWRPAPAIGPLRARFDFRPPVGRQAVARYPAGEAITVPRHLTVGTVRTLITARTFAPHPRLAPAVPVLTPALALVLRTPLRAALDTAIGRLPEGPGEEARRGARYTIACVARGEDGTVARGAVHGTDVYGITAAIASRAAVLLADGEGRATGTQPPAGAFDAGAFLAALAPHGIRVDRG